MTYEEALGVLGLDADNSDVEKIKIAYREMAQILHPDKYSDNHKLAARAEEQFKRLNEARDILLAATNRARTGGWNQQTRRSRTASNPQGSTVSRIDALKARLAGIAAARVQLTAQLDADFDSRRLALGLIIGGLIAFFIGERSGLRLLDAAGGTALVWGIIQATTVQARIKQLKAHLVELNKQRQQAEAELGQIE